MLPTLLTLRLLPLRKCSCSLPTVTLLSDHLAFIPSVPLPGPRADPLLLLCPRSSLAPWLHVCHFLFFFRSSFSLSFPVLSCVAALLRLPRRARPSSYPLPPLSHLFPPPPHLPFVICTPPSFEDAFTFRCQSCFLLPLPPPYLPFFDAFLPNCPRRPPADPFFFSAFLPD